MCFPNENKRSPTGLRQSYSGIWDQIKASVEAERRNEMASEGEEMYRVIKLLLYIFLNSTCSPGVGEGFTLVKDKYASGNFSFREDSPDTLLETRRAAIFLKTRNYFGNKLSGTLEVSLWWCAGTRRHWKVCSIKLEQQDDSWGYCFSMSSNWAEMSGWTLVFYNKTYSWLGTDHDVTTWNWFAFPAIRAPFHLALGGNLQQKYESNYLKSCNWFVFLKSCSQ